MKRASSDLQIRTFSDREILAAMADLNGSDDMPASDLAARLFGLKENEDDDVVQHATRCVISRLVWMRRYGLVDSMVEVVDGVQKKGTRTWKVSEVGRQLRFTHLGRSLSSAITNTPGASVLELTHQVAERMLREGDVGARAMRREFQHQIQRRSWR